MRPVLVLIVLAVAATAPAYASAQDTTGGVGVPGGATGGLSVPPRTGDEAGPGFATPPAGGAQAGAPSERSAAPASSGSPANGGADPVRARAAQDTPPEAPPAQAPPDDGEAEVQVPIEEGAPEPATPRPSPSVTTFGGLAPTGLAIAAFALLGAVAAAGGLGLRRLARQPSG